MPSAHGSLAAVRAKLLRLVPRSPEPEPQSRYQPKEGEYDGTITEQEWAEWQKEVAERTERIRKEQEEFDWSSSSCIGGPPFKPEKPYFMFQAPSDEKPYDRKLRMLDQVQRACVACTMCELGRKAANRDGVVERDPHVFSNMNPTRFVVVGQNPGWAEVCKRVPFVGEAGENFDTEVVANGLTRQDFYICNTVRCYTSGNERPTEKHAMRCKPFLDIEINLIQPVLIATLGAVAFERVCPGHKFSEALGNLVESPLYEVPVFALYHPSPLNLKEPDRAAAFKEQMRLLCGMVKKLKRRLEREEQARQPQLPQ